MFLSEDFMQELKARNDIVDIVSQYVRLKRHGKNMTGLCPFHNEKTPSFNIYPESSSFYCFGCGVGGDVIVFTRIIENLDYMDAVRFLAQKSGLQMPEENKNDGLLNLKKLIYEVNREAARFYHEMLYSDEGSKALSYLKKRGLTPATIKHFGLGYSPKSRFALVNYLKSKGHNANVLVQANLAYSNKNGSFSDRFSDRVMFPIIDVRGNVVAFGGRILGDRKPKYLNTSDTLVFKKSSNLFAMNFAKNSNNDKLILAEGYMDVIALHQAGFKNTVATLGTALTQGQAAFMSRYASEVVIAYDSDEAGQKAASRAIPILRENGMLVRVLTIPKGKDPDEFIKSSGGDGSAYFKQLLENSKNDVEYRLQKAKSVHDMGTTDGKIAYMMEAVKILSALRNKIEQEIYAGKLSSEVGIEKSSILLQVNKLCKKNRELSEIKQFKYIQQQVAPKRDLINPEREANLRAANAEEALIAYVINNPEYVNNIISRLPSEKFCTNFNKQVYREITDRLVDGKPASLTDISHLFSIEENSRIAKMLSKYVPDSQNTKASDEYIKVILYERNRMNLSKTDNPDIADIKDYIKKLRELKK